jgi:IS5 family transposase
LIELLNLAKRLEPQQRKEKNKLYSAHAQEVECIAKGKIHKPYEFGNKASFVTTAKSNWLAGAQSLQGIPLTDTPWMAHLRKSARSPRNAYCN